MSSEMTRVPATGALQTSSLGAKEPQLLPLESHPGTPQLGPVSHAPSDKLIYKPAGPWESGLGTGSKAPYQMQAVAPYWSPVSKGTRAPPAAPPGAPQRTGPSSRKACGRWLCLRGPGKEPSPRPCGAKARTAWLPAGPARPLPVRTPQRGQELPSTLQTDSDLPPGVSASLSGNPEHMN